MKKILIIIVVIIGILYIPLIPEERPSDQWSTIAFQNQKATVESLGQMLRDIEPQKGKVYNLCIRFGESNVKRSLFGIKNGNYHWSQHAFGALVPFGCPYLIYGEGEYCWIPPEHYEDFVRWSEQRIVEKGYRS